MRFLNICRKGNNSSGKDCRESKGGGYGLKVMVLMLFALISLGSVSGSAQQASNVNADSSDSVAAKVICNVVVFVQRLGLPIMTGVILGSSIMAIFGKLAWPAIVMLVVFTAIFFGAGKLMQKFAAGINSEIGKADSFVCQGDGKTSFAS